MRVVVGVRRRRRRLALRCFLLSSAFSTLVGLLLLSSSRSDDLPLKAAVVAKVADTTSRSDVGGNKTCATVEEMGEVFRGGSLKEALRLRKIIQNHFAINGTNS
nr:uncharacterized protein LOC109180334 isoform X3 [Ipomoea batatas]